MMVQEGPKYVGVKYTLDHFMFLINSAFVGKIFLHLSKCTVKQQSKKMNCAAMCAFRKYAKAYKKVSDIKIQAVPVRAKSIHADRPTDEQT
jgi:hypothetical protein